MSHAMTRRVAEALRRCGCTLRLVSADGTRLSTMHVPPENTAWAVRAGQVVNVQQLVFPRAASLSAATSLEIHVSGHVHHLHRFQSPVLFGAGDTPVLAKAVLRLRIT